MNLPEDLKHGARGRHPARIAAGVIAGVIVVVLVATDISGCILDDTEIRKALADAQKRSEVAKRVNAYACGYLHGQRAIIQNARLRMQEPEFMDSCPTYTDEAITLGFNVARKNR